MHSIPDTTRAGGGRREAGGGRREAGGGRRLVCVWGGVLVPGRRGRSPGRPTPPRTPACQAALTPLPCPAQPQCRAAAAGIQLARPAPPPGTDGFSGAWQTKPGPSGRRLGADWGRAAGSARGGTGGGARASPCAPAAPRACGGGGAAARSSAPSRTPPGTRTGTPAAPPPPPPPPPRAPQPGPPPPRPKSPSPPPPSTAACTHICRSRDLAQHARVRRNARHTHASASRPRGPRPRRPRPAAKPCIASWVNSCAAKPTARSSESLPCLLCGGPGSPQSLPGPRGGPASDGLHDRHRERASTGRPARPLRAGRPARPAMSGMAGLPRLGCVCSRRPGPIGRRQRSRATVTGDVAAAVSRQGHEEDTRPATGDAVV